MLVIKRSERMLKNKIQHTAHQIVIMLTLLGVLLGMINIGFCDSVEKAKIKPSEFKNLKLTKKEIEFIDRLAKEQKDFLNSVLILLALAEINDTPKVIPKNKLKELPKTAGELAIEIESAVILTVDSDTFARAVKGMHQLSARKAYEETTLLLIGKHPDFPGYRPKGDNHRFFKCLNEMYTKTAIGG